MFVEDPERQEQKLARAAELRIRIVRAESWSQLFVTSEEAEEDFFNNLIQANINYYGKENPLPYVREAHPEGDIHRLTWGQGIYTTFLRLPNGNVVISHYQPESDSNVSIITPSIGNIDHPFTIANTVKPKDIEDRNLRREITEIIGDDPGFTFTFLRGKPATPGWEDIMLYKGQMPQRIGHRIFPHSALEAQAKIKDMYPDLMPK